MRFLWLLITWRRNKKREPVSVLDSIVNDTDWYRAKAKRTKDRKP